MHGILKLEDLYALQTAISDAGYGEDDFEIVMRVRNRAVLEKVNEEFYYQEGNANKDEAAAPPDDVDEVNVRIANVNFKYIVNENAE